VKAFILKEDDFRMLLAAIRDPLPGREEATSVAMSEEERRAHVAAHAFFVYQVRAWIDWVKT
jgi:hypothetical protein